jgi:predicted AAA+ superfamily ATPase
MTKKDIIKSLIRDFHHRPLPDLVTRDLSIPANIKKIITVTGPRRCGKTFRLFQVASQLIKNKPKESVLYINFEDERLDLAVSELDLVIQAYRELYPGQEIRDCAFLLDEIQNVPGWEKFIRRIYDTISPNIYITGSNSRLLSSDISTSLRGRSINYELYPLSFREFLRFKNIGYDPYVPEMMAQVNHELENYIEWGGFPEVANIKDSIVRNKILQEYYHVMLFRDLVEHYQIRNTTALKFFLKRLFSSATKEVSVNRIYNDLKSAGIRIGKNTLYDFLSYAEAIFLVGCLPKYSPKLSVREFGERRIFAIDNGLLNAVIYRFTNDRGKAVEQIVYWELRRRNNEIFFLKNGFECDFLIKSYETRQKEVIQVCVDMSEPTTRKREIKGLLAACRIAGLESGVVVTMEEQDEFVVDGIGVRLVPLVHFLLESGHQ